MTIAAAAARTGITSPDLRIHSIDSATWSYELLYVKAGTKREELEAITRPFLTQFMSGEFSQGTTLSAFYNQLEATADQILHNPPETFGAVCASRRIKLLVLPTAKAIEVLKENPPETNAILHVTC